MCIQDKQSFSEVINMPQMIDLHPKMKICWKLFHPFGHPRCRWVCLSDKNLRNIALHHSLTNRSSAVNGCRQNESPRDIGENEETGSEGAVIERTVIYVPSPAHIVRFGPRFVCLILIMKILKDSYNPRLKCIVWLLVLHVHRQPINGCCNHIQHVRPFLWWTYK